MGSGMNLEEAKEYAKTMTYSEAVANVKYSKGIKYRKATMIKLRELAEIADRLDRKTEPSGYNLSPVEDEPQTEEWYTYQDEQEYRDRWDAEPQTERKE